MNQPPNPQWMPQFQNVPPRRVRHRRLLPAEKAFAVGLLNQGWSCRQVARKMGCSAASPLRWRKKALRAAAAAHAQARIPVVQPPPPPPPAQQNNCVIV